MKPIYFGKKNSGEDLYLDLEKEGIRFISLLGETTSGKSVFHENLYKELTEKYTPEELGFIFMDMTRVDFVDWRLPEYLIKPTIVEPDEALDVLGNVKDENKIIFIHIEECDMAFVNRAKMEKGLDKIRKKENIFLVYSTSRIDQSYLKDWMDKYFDLNVIFKTATEEDSQFLLGNNNSFNFEYPGEKILSFNNKQIKLIPLEKETGEFNDLENEIFYDVDEAKVYIWERLSSEEQRRISQDDIENISEIEVEYINKTGEFSEKGIQYIKDEAAKQGKKYLKKDIERITDIETDYLRIIGAIES